MDRDDSKWYHSYEEDFEWCCFILEELNDPISNVSILYEDLEGKHLSYHKDDTYILIILSEKLSIHFNSINSTFSKKYDEGIIEPIPN